MVCLVLRVDYGADCRWCRVSVTAVVSVDGDVVAATVVAVVVAAGVVVAVADVGVLVRERLPSPRVKR